MSIKSDFVSVLIWNMQYLNSTECMYVWMNVFIIYLFK